MPALATISETVAAQTEEINSENEVIKDLILEGFEDGEVNGEEVLIPQEGVVEIDEDGHGEFVDDLLK
jgi:hypothetical protein